MEDLFMDILCRGLGVAIVVATDKFVVRRRDAIVQTVRRLQATFNIPPCLSVVSDTAPGITDESLRHGTEMAVFFGIGSLALFVAVAVVGQAKSLWGLVAATVIPACATIFVWIYLICARHRFDQGERDTFEDCSGNNPGLWRSIGGMLGAV
ncbi:hypothetical protein ANO14919_109530 [Xylariales sp. No.14919]|nr:hypothetical protein ANO14919_109530 [Xylariales sp. No.14919]